MVERKYDLERVAHIVDNEGLDYAIMSYMSSASIEDEELAALWDQAYEVLTKIEKILDPYMP